MTDGAADGRAAGFVLPPDVIDRLAGDRNPTAGFARDLDHAVRVRMRPAIASRCLFPAIKLSGYADAKGESPGAYPLRSESSWDPKSSFAYENTSMSM